MKQIALIVSFFVAIWALSSAVNQASEEQENPPDVLIIYSSGTPFKTISDMNAKEVDAVTTPTPVRENCKSIAEKLASALRNKKFVVRVAETTEIKHHNEILRARLVVLGSPAYFANVSWRMKKLFDEQFAKIYVLGKDGLANRRIAAFSMAEVESSAHAALKAINAVVRNCKGRLGPTMTFLTKHSREEVNRRISRFVEQMAVAAKQN